MYRIDDTVRVCRVQEEDDLCVGSSEDRRVSPVKKFGVCRCEEKDPCVGSTARFKAYSCIDDCRGSAAASIAEAGSIDSFGIALQDRHSKTMLLVAVDSVALTAPIQGCVSGNFPMSMDG